MIKKILLAIDGSAHSNKAVDYALDLAEKFGASITVLNVFQPVLLRGMIEQPGFTLGSDAAINKDLMRFHDKLVASTLEKAKMQKPNLTVTGVLKQGDPAQQILETAKTGGFDTIVLGSRGESGIQGLLMGSVSDKVSKHAEATVVIVK
jgi:nucleotide-binding universal stress UspA family protein